MVPALAAALQDESAATAYAAAQVLAALGRSAETPQRRAKITAALAAALRDPRSRRGVYVLGAKQAIQYLGRLDEALYRGLVQVTGAAGGAARPAVERSNSSPLESLLRRPGEGRPEKGARWLREDAAEPPVASAGCVSAMGVGA